MTAIALALHVFGAVGWVGGMFAAYVCLRPAAGPLDAPQRLTLWRAFFGQFLPWVWVSVVLLLASGYWILFGVMGGFRGAGVHVHIMHALGWAMIALFFWLFHDPWLKFRRAVDAKDFPAAGGQLNRIRKIIMVNLPLGLIVTIVGASGRYWN